MGSSDDEFAGYNHSPQVTTKSTKPSSNAIAGPSTKRNDTSTSMRTTAIKPVDTLSDGDEEEVVRNPKQTAKRGRAASGARSTNGRAPSSKGKRKETSPPPNKRKKGEGEDEIQEVEAETEDEVKPSQPTHPPAPQNQRRLQEQLTRLQKMCDEMQQQRDTFAKKFEELVQIRQTATEILMAEQKIVYEARLQAQADIITELQASLARADPLAQPGGGTSLHFLTRETADQEKQGVQREVNKLKNVIRERDTLIKDKDKEIAQLDDTIRTLRLDLKTEIENTKTLASRNPPPSATKRPGSDPKHAFVILLYEEFTNLLITNVKHEPGPHKDGIVTYTCVQTSSAGQSLNFTLKCFEDFDGETGQLQQKVIYTPHELENETREFVDQLDFLGNPFTFSREQMPVFLDTIKKHLTDESEDAASEDTQMEDT